MIDWLSYTLSPSQLFCRSWVRPRMAPSRLRTPPRIRTKMKFHSPLAVTTIPLPQCPLPRPDKYRRTEPRWRTFPWPSPRPTWICARTAVEGLITRPSISDPSARLAKVTGAPIRRRRKRMAKRNLLVSVHGNTRIVSSNSFSECDLISPPEAVNLELVNMNGNKNGRNSPKKEVHIGDPYDEYFVPVNEHRKFMRYALNTLCYLVVCTTPNHPLY